MYKVFHKKNGFKGAQNQSGHEELNFIRSNLLCFVVLKKVIWALTIRSRQLTA